TGSRLGGPRRLEPHYERFPPSRLSNRKKMATACSLRPATAMEYVTGRIRGRIITAPAPVGGREQSERKRDLAMTLRTWVRKWFTGRTAGRPVAAKKAPQWHLALEGLEERAVPSISPLYRISDIARIRPIITTRTEPVKVGDFGVGASGPQLVAVG